MGGGAGVGTGVTGGLPNCEPRPSKLYSGDFGAARNVVVPSRLCQLVCGVFVMEVRRRWRR